MFTQRDSHWSRFGLATRRADGGGGGAVAPPDAANMRAWMDSLDFDGSNNSTLTNGDSLAAVVNKGTLGGTFAQATGANRPTYTTGALNGRPAALFDGNDNIVSSLTAADWAFLSDGSPFTIYTLAKTTSADPNAFQVLLATATGASAARGLVYGPDDRSGLSRNDTQALAISNGSALVDNLAGTNNTAVSGVWNMLDAVRGVTTTSLYANGTQVATAVAGALVAGNPTAPLRFGAATNGTLPFAGLLATVVIYAGEHSPATQAQVWAWMAARYGVGSFPVP